MAEYIERRAAHDAVVDAIWHGKRSMYSVANAINSVPTADVATVRNCRCPVCSGNAVLTQDCDNGYSLEIDAEQQETSLWYGDERLAVFHIDYCPNCGAKMECCNDG